MVLKIYYFLQTIIILQEKLIWKKLSNPILNIDQFSESILVIKKPPIESPQVQLITTRVKKII
jgi:hypothetical protein